MQSAAVERDFQRLKPAQEQVQRKRLPVPAGGINANRPPSEIADDEVVSSVNLRLNRGRVEPDSGYVALGSGAISGTPQATVQVNHSDGSSSLLLITTSRAYWLDQHEEWVDGGIALNGDAMQPVSWVSYAPFDWVVFTNEIDPVFYFYLGAFHTVAFDIGPVVCRSLAVFHESLLLIGTTEGSVKHFRRVRMSDAGNPMAMQTVIEGADTGIAAIYDLLDTDDDLHCAFPLGPYLILYRHSSVMRATYYGLLNQILFWEYMIVGDGAQSVGSVCPVTIPQRDAYHVVVGADDIYRYRGDYSLEPISGNIWQQFLGARGVLNQLAKSAIWCHYVPQWDEVWIGIPTNESEVPDTVLRLVLSQPQRPAWLLRRFYDPFLAAESRLVRFEEDQSVPVVLLTGSAGVYQYDYVTPLDNGQPVRWSLETKDVGDGDAISRFDRLLLRGEGQYDIGVELSLDRGKSWSFAGTVNFAFAALAVLTFNLTGEYLRVRLSGSDPSFRLTWIEVWFMFEAEWAPIASLRSATV